MKANRAYELLVRRGGRGPALLRSSAETDHIEVVDRAVGPHHGGHGDDARRARLGRRALELLARAAQPGALEHRGRVHLARRGGDQHVVALGQVAAAGERLPERGEAERDRAAD